MLIFIQEIGLQLFLWLLQLIVGLMENFYEIVQEALRPDERFWAKDGVFLRNAVYEAAMGMDGNLLRLLLGNAETKRRFFRNVDGIGVFDKAGFAWTINNRQFLPDS